MKGTWSAVWVGAGTRTLSSFYLPPCPTIHKLTCAVRGTNPSTLARGPILEATSGQMAPAKSGHPLRMPPKSDGIPGRVHFVEVPFALMVYPGWVQTCGGNESCHLFGGAAAGESTRMQSRIDIRFRFQFSVSGFGCLFRFSGFRSLARPAVGTRAAICTGARRWGRGRGCSPASCSPARAGPRR